MFKPFSAAFQSVPCPDSVLQAFPCGFRQFLKLYFDRVAGFATFRSFQADAPTAFKRLSSLAQLAVLKSLGLLLLSFVQSSTEASPRILFEIKGKNRPLSIFSLNFRLNQ